MSNAVNEPYPEICWTIRSDVHFVGLSSSFYIFAQTYSLLIFNRETENTGRQMKREADGQTGRQGQRMR